MINRSFLALPSSADLAEPLSEGSAWSRNMHIYHRASIFIHAQFPGVNKKM